MITADVRDFLEEQLEEFEVIYNGPLANTKKEKLMSLKRGITTQPRAIVSDSSYSRLAVNTILHWNKNYKQTEQKAKELHDFILSLDHPIIGGHQVVLINMRNFVSLDRDENDIYEHAIDFEIIYERQKNG